MPALIGYLIALTLLLGGGYAGLEWLGAPDEPVISQHSKATASAAGKRAEARKSMASAEPITKPESVAPVGAVEVNKVGRDEPKIGSASTEVVKASAPEEAAPADGCKPIGLTASGQMVFPLQCRDVFDAKRSAAIPAAPEPKVSAPKQQEAQAAEPSNEPAGKAAAETAVADARHDQGLTNSAPASEPAPAQKAVASDASASTMASPPNDLAQNSAPARQQLAEPEPAQAALDKALSTSQARPSAKRSFAEARAPKPERSKPAADRSRLVRMTLLTVEYPDGHREQRLVPYRRFRSVPDYDAPDYDDY
jgi:hypothetical protein